MADVILRVRMRATARRAFVGACVVGAAAVVAVDSATGRTFSFAMFYVVVVVAAAALTSLRSALVLALVCSIAWEGADVLLVEERAVTWVDAWNAVTRFMVLALVASLVDRMVVLLAESRSTERRSREFLAAAAHQLRTPAAAVQASSEALLLRGGHEPDVELLASIATETRRIGRVVAALLRLARLDQGEHGQRGWADVAEVCREEIARIGRLGAPPVSLRIERPFPSSLFVDVEAIRDCLANLLENAARHAVHVVSVSVSHQGDVLRIDVADDGPGLPAGLEHRAFERFVTLDGRGGSGLGLAIARDAVVHSGGDVVYADKTFRVELPARARARVVNPVREPGQARTPAASARRREAPRRRR